MRGRAFRRHHAKRMKTKARKFLSGVWTSIAVMKGPNFGQNMEFAKGGFSLNPPLKMVGLWASTHCKPCNCSMCSSPRKHFNEESLQERKAKQRERYGVE